MKEEYLKRVIRDGLKEVLEGYGFTVDSPNDVQQDMIHLRKLRMGCEATKRNILKAFVTVTIPATIFIFWEAVKGALVR